MVGKLESSARHSAVVLLDDEIFQRRRVEYEAGGLERRAQRCKVEGDPEAGVGGRDRRRRLLAEIGREERLQLGGAVGARRQVLRRKRKRSARRKRRRKPALRAGRFECDE
jgi:hypothetical protein